MDKMILLKVISPEKTLFEGPVSEFILKTNGENGEFAVMYDHIPLASIIGSGRLEIMLPEGEKKVSTIFGGYMVVNKNNAVILTDACEWPEEIDFERAQASKDRALERLSSQDQKYNVKRAKYSLERAEIRLSFKKD